MDLNNKKVIDVSSELQNDNIILGSNRSYYKIPYYSNNKFIDGKEFIKFIKHVEKQVRISDDYSHYLGYLKELGFNKCAFLNNITDEDASIEFHHYPFTLYDICQVIIENKLRNNEHVTTFSCAKEVIECHKRNIIGLVPLSKTVHELYHSGQIFINLLKNIIYLNIIKT